MPKNKIYVEESGDEDYSSSDEEIVEEASPYLLYYLPSSKWCKKFLNILDKIPEISENVACIDTTYISEMDNAYQALFQYATNAPCIFVRSDVDTEGEDSEDDEEEVSYSKDPIQGDYAFIWLLNKITKLIESLSIEQSQTKLSFSQSQEIKEKLANYIYYQKTLSNEIQSRNQNFFSTKNNSTNNNQVTGKKSPSHHEVTQNPTAVNLDDIEDGIDNRQIIADRLQEKWIAEKKLQLDKEGNLVPVINRTKQRTAKPVAFNLSMKNAFESERESYKDKKIDAKKQQNIIPKNKQKYRDNTPISGRGNLDIMDRFNQEIGSDVFHQK